MDTLELKVHTRGPHDWKLYESVHDGAMSIVPNHLKDTTHFLRDYISNAHVRPDPLAHRYHCYLTAIC